jgi:hypothetical protein
MLDLAYDDIEQNGMMPEEFKNKDIPLFTLRLNVPHLPANNKQNTTRPTTIMKSKERRHTTLKLPKRRCPS